MRWTERNRYAWQLYCSVSASMAANPQPTQAGERYPNPDMLLEHCIARATTFMEKVYGKDWCVYYKETGKEADQ